MKKVTLIDVYEIRGRNYQDHFSCRAWAILHPRGTQLAYMVGQLARPRLNLFGVAEFPASACEDGWLLPREYYDLAKLYEIEPGCLHYWYWSLDGWSAFQHEWSQLAKAVNIPLTAGVRLVTKDTYGYPSGGR